MALCDQHQGGVWYLHSDSRLTWEEREEIVEATIELLCTGEERCEIMRPGSYEGIITNTEKYEMIGALGGRRFDIELDTNYGRTSIALLVDAERCSSSESPRVREEEYVN